MTTPNDYVQLHSWTYPVAQQIATALGLEIDRIAHYTPGIVGVSCSLLSHGGVRPQRWTAEQRQEFIAMVAYYDAREW